MKKRLPMRLTTYNSIKLLLTLFWQILTNYLTTFSIGHFEPSNRSTTALPEKEIWRGASLVAGSYPRFIPSPYRHVLPSNAGQASSQCYA
jgi:hypothetical protein